MSTFRFEHNGLSGEMKPASETDHPGELMIASMPLARNVKMDGKQNILTSCPLCGSDCYASSQLSEAARIYPSRIIAACSECAIKAHINKGYVPQLMKEKRITADDLLRPILDLFRSIGAVPDGNKK
jgi:hypothetical protein